MEQHYGQLPLTIKLSDYDELDLWSGKLTRTEVREKIERINLQANPSWTGDIERWGTEDGDRVEVLFNEGNITDFSARIDLRQINFKFISNLVALGEDVNCVFLTQDSYVLRPSMSRLLTLIKRSASFRYVIDPEEFFRKFVDVAIGDNNQLKAADD